MVVFNASVAKATLGIGTAMSWQTRFKIPRDVQISTNASPILIHAPRHNRVLIHREAFNAFVLQIIRFLSHQLMELELVYQHIRFKSKIAGAVPSWRIMMISLCVGGGTGL
jgi:hypothetical protein